MWSSSIPDRSGVFYWRVGPSPGAKVEIVRLFASGAWRDVEMFGSAQRLPATTLGGQWWPVPDLPQEPERDRPVYSDPDVLPDRAAVEQASLELRVAELERTLRRIVQSLADRVAVQSEILARRAEKTA